MGQSTNSMARIMKTNQMSKVCGSSHEYPHVEKIKNLCEQNFKGKVAQPTVTAKELTSRQKEKQRKNLTAKRKTSGQKEKRVTAKEKRIKNALSASKKFCRESFSLCCEVFPFAVRVFFLA